MEDHAIFLNSFPVCSPCKQKFVVFPFVDEEKKRSYPFANGLNGLAHPLLLYFCCYTFVV